MKPRLLILRAGAIGDALLTAPALVALRRHHPDHLIWLASNSSAAPVLEAMGLVDAWWPFDGPAVTRLFMSGAPGPDDAFSRISAAIAWGADPDGVLAASLARRGADPVLIAPSRPAAGEIGHVSQHLLRALALPLAVGADVAMPAIQIPINAQRQADDLLQRIGLDEARFVLVQPGSGSPTKNWPAERYARVIDALRARDGLATLLLAGPADDAAIRRVATSLEQPVPVVANAPLLIVAALARRARGYLGNDSGLSHLAGLADVPTLALFGPTDPALWRPLGLRVRVLRQQPLAELDPDTVIEELMLLLPGR